MKTITWKLLLRADISTIFKLLTTANGREKFWCEEASEAGNQIHFLFPNGQSYIGEIRKSISNKEVHLIYFGSLVKFQLKSLSTGGTELTMVNEGVNEKEYMEMYAGWVSVLLNLKAVADYQCDLRNHNPLKTWDQGYVDN